MRRDICPCCGEWGYDDPSNCSFCEDQHTHLVIDMSGYEGDRPLRLFDPTLHIINRIGPMSAWVSTEQPERWGYNRAEGFIPWQNAKMRGIRVFPASTLTRAKGQIEAWGWLDQAALDA